MAKLTKEVQVANNPTDDKASVSLIVPRIFSFGGGTAPSLDSVIHFSLNPQTYPNLIQKPHLPEPRTAHKEIYRNGT